MMVLVRVGTLMKQLGGMASMMMPHACWYVY